MRIREPKTTALIFASGKMVVTGAKSEDDSKLASRKYARIIQKLGFNAKFTDFKIQNIVGSCDIKFPIRLEGLASKHHNFSSYEPELFPGLIYRMIKPKIVLLIFVSGKIVLTGAKVREEIYQAFEMIYPVLQGMSLYCVCIATKSFLTDTFRFPQDLNPLDPRDFSRPASLAHTLTDFVHYSPTLFMRPRPAYPTKKTYPGNSTYLQRCLPDVVPFASFLQHCIGVQAGNLQGGNVRPRQIHRLIYSHRLRMESSTQRACTAAMSAGRLPS